MTRTTKAQRDELRLLHAEATPAPWAYDDGVTDGDRATGERGKYPWVTTKDGNKLICQPEGDADSDRKEHLLPSTTEMDGNGDLIAKSRNALPALLDDLDAAEAERDALNAQWADQIAAALNSTADRLGREAQEMAAHVRREHEAHTACFARLRKAADERDDARAKLAALVEFNQADLDRTRKEVWPDCEFCRDSTHDHECAGPEQNPRWAELNAAIAAARGGAS
mgnify:CR=1 FL=1